MSIIHIMADGTRRESVEGVVIESKEFYEILQSIKEKEKQNES